MIEILVVLAVANCLLIDYIIYKLYKSFKNMRFF